MREVFRLSTVKMASDIRPAPQPRLAAFIVLPSIMTRKFTTVIARAQFYVLRTKSNIQLRQEIGGRKRVLSSKENRWRLCVFRSTVNLDKKLRHRFRDRSYYTLLKSNPSYNSDRTTYQLIWKRNIGF